MFYEHLSKPISQKIIYIETCTFLANTRISKILRLSNIHYQAWSRICAGYHTEETAHRYLDIIIERCFPETTPEHIEIINYRYAELCKGVNIKHVKRLGGAEKCQKKNKLQTLPI